MPNFLEKSPSRFNRICIRLKLRNLRDEAQRVSHKEAKNKLIQAIYFYVYRLYGFRIQEFHAQNTY